MGPLWINIDHSNVQLCNQQNPNPCVCSVEFCSRREGQEGRGKGEAGECKEGVWGMMQHQSGHYLFGEESPCHYWATVNSVTSSLFFFFFLNPNIFKQRTETCLWLNHIIFNRWYNSCSRCDLTVWLYLQFWWIINWSQKDLHSIVWIGPQGCRKELHIFCTMTFFFYWSLIYRFGGGTHSVSS